jgi:hypothetical protein
VRSKRSFIIRHEQHKSESAIINHIQRKKKEQLLLRVDLEIFIERKYQQSCLEADEYP